MKHIIPTLLFLCLLASGILAADLPLVPYPHKVEVKSGTVELTKTSSIAVDQNDWKPLAELFAEEIRMIHGLTLSIADGAGKKGDIVLQFDDKLAEDEYKIVVGDKAVVNASSYVAAGYGTVTLLQSMQTTNAGKVSVPKMTVEDRPDFEFRGLLVDTARKPHSIDSLKQIVRLCRFYKIRFLHLHLTDGPLWMFPSEAYPLLGTTNNGKTPPYTLDELRDLVAFSEQNGVTIIPEYEIPGHSGTSNRSYTDLFKIRGTVPYEHHASINFVREDVMKAVTTIIGEMCDVFAPTPYFHVGGDEADLAFAMQNEDFKKAAEETGLKNQYELYCRLLGQLNDIVKANSKKMLVWEGFHRNNNPPVPKDIVVFVYENRFYLPNHLAEDGYTIVNASWVPLYVVNNTRRSPDEIYAWNVRQFKAHGSKPEATGIVLKDNTNLWGAHMCAWEQQEKLEIPSLRFRLPAMSERIWFDEAGRTFDDFQSRVLWTDALLDRLIHRMDVSVTNLARPTLSQFDDSVTVSAKTGEGVIRYALDMKIPTAESPVFDRPMTLDASTDLTLQVFDAENHPIGYPRWIRYERSTGITDPSRPVREQR